MKIKDDIEWKWSNGWTIYDIADEYNTTPEAVLKLLGIQENPLVMNYTEDQTQHIVDAYKAEATMLTVEN